MAGDFGSKNALHREPELPWESAYPETFVSWMRDELLGREVFANVAGVRVLTGHYRERCNHRRPHGALGYKTPAEFAALEAHLDRSSAPSEQLQSVLGFPL